MFDSISLAILAGLIKTQTSFYLMGLFAGFILLALNQDKESERRELYWGIGLFCLTPLLAYFATPFMADLAGYEHTPLKEQLLYWLLSVIAGLGIVFAWLRWGVRKLDKFKAKVTVKTDLERNRKTDVREIEHHLPKKVHDFDPLKYMDKKRGVFLGLDEKEQPSFIEFGTGNSAPHIQVIGTTGAGKGVSLGVMGSQYLERQESVFIFDPKDDEFFPSVMYASAKRLGKPYHFVNLKRPNGAQFNLFEGATSEEAFELFQAGLGLTDKGDISDFYGIDDRKAAISTAQRMAEGNLSIAEVYNDLEAEFTSKDFQAKKFAGRLAEMAALPSINAKSGEGISLAKVVEEGGCVYVIGSMRNDIVKTAQRMLLIRLIQLAERRDRMGDEELRKMCIVLDEVKYHISRPALEALGACRDKGVHLILTHQSFGDLKDCPKDLNADAVVDAVVENCKVKICYQVMSPETAEWLAAMSGTILVDDETRTVNKNIVQAETVDSERRISQTERFFVDVNMLRNLPKSCAVVYGDGLAKFVSIRPLKVKKARESIEVKTVQGTVSKTGHESINLDDDEATPSSGFGTTSNQEANPVLDL
ncbi:MAG: type IV secretory system conjugative DNA transfer family protein [Sideroxydans sp.]|nr:type IV secretory system conjugative DNA transfer family protein [Sideroxydans sp.]